ncbi:hypothetical protein DOT_5080 [Desulfosporosinus sp. OT]|nr:hypothetical protein DOT_5080 [Desulfosporosinus sp. OT]
MKGVIEVWLWNEAVIRHRAGRGALQVDSKVYVIELLI